MFAGIVPVRTQIPAVRPCSHTVHATTLTLTVTVLFEN